MKFIYYVDLKNNKIKHIEKKYHLAKGYTLFLLEK